MQELRQIMELFKHKTLSLKSTKLLELLSNEGEILDMAVQLENDEGLYIRYSSKRYFNFSEITKTLYNEFDLVVKAFDDNNNGTRTVWLVTKNSLKCAS